mgnify:CR=1 FL=1
MKDILMTSNYVHVMEDHDQLCKNDFLLQVHWSEKHSLVHDDKIMDEKVSKLGCESYWIKEVYAKSMFRSWSKLMYI